MFEKLRKIIQLKSIVGIFFLCFPLMNLKGGTPMKKVSFEPQAWNELEFDWNEYVWSEVGNPCSPYFFGRGIIWKMNTVSMNIPEKIRAGKKGVTKIPVPVCVSFCLTDFRYCKYSDPEYKKK